VKVTIAAQKKCKTATITLWLPSKTHFHITTLDQWGVLVSVVLLISPTTWLICGLFNQDLVYGGKYADCLLIASS